MRAVQTCYDLSAVQVSLALQGAAAKEAVGALRQSAWVDFHVPGTEAILRQTLAKVADRLGRRVPGRAAAIEETIVPCTVERARPRSLSGAHGLRCLPLHVELSHRARPCRYVLFACLDTGTPSVATTLLDRRTLQFTADELLILRSAPILVRAGRRPFYSTILPSDDRYLRYDQCCMEAVDARGREAMHLLGVRLTECEPFRHRWTPGNMLIVDNWRALHGRDQAGATNGRRLARILIDG